MPRSIDDRVVQVAKDVLEVREGIDLLDVSITSELAPTSLDQMTLFLALEDEFQRTIPQEEVEGIDTVREIIQYVKEKLVSSE